MNLDLYMKQLQDTVIHPMKAFLNDWDDCGFTKKDIDKCEALLLSYLTALAAMTNPSDREIMKQVKKLVLALNKLNEKADYCLLETDEREAICELIQISAVDCGLTEYDDDITEEWREW